MKVITWTIPFSFLCLLLTLNCSEKTTQVSVSVRVKTNQGEPVEGASVKIGGRQSGVTDQLGVLEAKMTFPVGSRHQIEITKESDQFYFAPYFDYFTVSEDTPEVLPIKATLYFVPKPSPQNEETGVIPSKEVATTKTQGPTPHQEVVAEEKTEQPSQPPASAESVEEPNEPSKPKVTEPKVALSKVAPKQQEPTKKPKVIRKKLVTFHVFSGGRPVPLTEVFMGQSQGSLKPVCKTNARGRCTIKQDRLPKGVVRLVAKKEGFQTGRRSVRLKDKSKHQFDLKPGETIDIFAVTKTFNYSRGLAGVEVHVDGKHIGNTDPFGHLTYTYEGKKNDLVEVTLKSRDHLPQVYETDFVVGGPMSLVRYFTPRKPPPLKVTLLKVQPAGEIAPQQLKAFDGKVDQQIQRASQRHLFSSQTFKKYPIELFNRSSQKLGYTLSEMIKQGWHTTPMKSSVDAVLLPTLISKKSLELSLIDSRGRVVAAAKEPLRDINDTRSIDRAVSAISKKMSRVFPFEGAVTEARSDSVSINIGSATKRQIRVGDELDLYGVQRGTLGQKQTHKKIARLRTTKVGRHSSEAKLLDLAPRAMVERGDLIVLRPRKSNARPAEKSAGRRLLVTNGSNPVSRANVYLDERWIGATDAEGVIAVPGRKEGTVRVIKYGFQEAVRDMATNTKLVKVGLEREASFLLIDSDPPGAKVTLENQLVGKTPIAEPVQAPSGFTRIQVEGPAGYKTYTTVVEFEEGTIDLTGPRKVKLELDIRAAAHSLLAAGRTEQAVKKLESVPETHSDYLLANHEAGEVFLTLLDEPAEASRAFAKVTSQPEVKDFKDKRYIGSHINEGIALYLTGAKLASSEKKAANAHFAKAIETLQRARPYLRFIPRDEYPQAVHNIDFYTALSRHKIWSHSPESNLASQVTKSWKAYLEGSAKSVPTTETTDGFVKTAQVYYKQLVATESSRKKESP